MFPRHLAKRRRIRHPGGSGGSPYHLPKAVEARETPNCSRTARKTRKGKSRKGPLLLATPALSFGAPADDRGNLFRIRAVSGSALGWTVRIVTVLPSDAKCLALPEIRRLQRCNR